MPTPTSTTATPAAGLGAGWVPIATIFPSDWPPPASASPTPLSSPREGEEEEEEEDDEAPLELRQVAGQNPNVSPTPVFTQVDPVTTLWLATVVNGVTTAVQVVYSQAFSSVPSQGPSPASGQIGMGTLTGVIGVLRTDEARNGAMRLGSAMWTGVVGIGLGITVLVGLFV
ncbi:MAG: hypothetical protein M1827_001529 [Pycnora praestabilis]|nr:MAG: hypothetical protein M1827_001529 [Pycnora praestabilis]